jgi:hypothetical protein
VTEVVEIVVGSTSAAWQAIGLSVTDDAADIGGIGLRFEPPTDGLPTGIVAWTLRGSPSQYSSIDGLATRYVDERAPVATSRVVDHSLGVVSFDHIVVMTSSLERSCGAIESATAEPLKRIREVGPIRQGFHRLGALVVEVVETADVVTECAAFWGFVFVVDDIRDAATRLGPELVSAPKAAVQPGRFIASFRREAGLGFPVALMSR